MKKQIILAIITKLREELAATLASASAAHEAATGAESRAENQYDTRGLEASYLAEAQMKRAADGERQIAMYMAMLDHIPRGGTGVSPLQVSVGSLVELAQGTRRTHYFIVNGGGGLSLQVEGRTINVITTQSPMGDALLAHQIGNVVEVEMQGTTRHFTVVSVS